MKPMMVNPGAAYKMPEQVARNPYYANLLHEMFCGTYSEMRCIKQYLYHYFMTDNSELADSLKSIYMAEMIHMDVLGRLVKMYGSEPRYYIHNSAPQICGPDTVYYGKEITDMLYDDIECERQVINTYNLIAGNIKQPEVAEIVRQIIADEELHLSWFQQAYKNL